MDFSSRRRARLMKPAAGRRCRPSWTTLHRSYDAQGILTDENGRDLLTGGTAPA